MTKDIAIILDGPELSEIDAVLTYYLERMQGQLDTRREARLRGIRRRCLEAQRATPAPEPTPTAPVCGTRSRITKRIVTAKKPGRRHGDSR
jgi:hypothetical protein